VSRAMNIAIAIAIGLGLAGSAVAGCDQFEPAAAEAKANERPEERARKAAQGALAAVMKAAQAATASCAAGDLLWEAERVEGMAVPRHYSRPCIPERCAPAPAEVEALRTSVLTAKKVVEAEPSLRVPSFQGFVALGEAMVSFIDTALAGMAAATEKEKPLRLSGLSMHYAALATAYRGIYADADAPLEPPSLVKSLAVEQPGGDPCKAWARPEDCDVRGVRLPKDRRWRTDPPCIEVEGIPT
jgi:hypothetical protein